jgi:uncharacterized protein YndB with AHSA1/START domain
VYVVYIQATADAVWSGLIDPRLTRIYWQHENISDWNVGSPWEHKAVPSGKLDIVGEVIESERPYRLVLSWARPSDKGNKAMTSHVSFMIEPQEWPGGPWVRLTVAHTDMDEEMRDSVSFGWPAVLSVLKTLLESKFLEKTA